MATEFPGSLVQPDAGFPGEIQCGVSLNSLHLSYGCETGAADGAPHPVTGFVQACTCLYASYAQLYYWLDPMFPAASRLGTRLGNSTRIDEAGRARPNELTTW